MSGRAVAAALALLAWACGGEETPAEERAPPRAAPAFAPVVAEAIAALERELEAQARPTPPPPDDLEERVAGLLPSAAGSRDQLGRLALEELAGLGDAAVPLLAARLLDVEVPLAERRAAAEVLAAVDTPASVDALLAMLERSRTDVAREPQLYAWCAWQVAATSQDQAVPRLLLVLKYETDFETVIWTTHALARFANLAGLEALGVIEAQAHDERLRAEAAALRARLASETGFEDAAALARAWEQGDPALPPEVLSPRHRLALWRSVRALAEWQLRGVDDARFALSRSREGAAEILGAALRDRDRYVRVHAAQCLERMGPRGRAAAPALVAALDDPDAAPQAALALGALGEPVAAQPLLARLTAAADLELRVAAARALGDLGLASSAPELARLAADEDEAVDLRAAAAGSVLACAPMGDPAVAPALALLREHLTSGAVEPTAVERALEAWLRRRAADGDEATATALDAWLALAPAPQAERLPARAALLDGLAPH